MNKNTFAIHTLGCKVNTYESQVMINDLTSNGYIEVDFNQKSDIYIINTCTVTNVADSKSRNIISRANKLNPNAIIIVAGCYAQTGAEEIKKKLKVDILLGNKYKNNIVQLIEEFYKSKKQIDKVENLMLEKEFEITNSSSFENRTRAFIKIQDGCNFMCSYCAIPFARGKQRSAKPEYIINQIKEFIKRGFKEIVLTGVNTAGYENGDCNFYKLLKLINDVDGDFRVRISSVEPFQINNEIIDIIMTNPKRFCNHWHLCLQSGSKNILKQMNRKYSPKDFSELMKKIRSYNPLVCFSTDLIVGFPGETDNDFDESLKFLEKNHMGFCHIFTYSKRKNTAASKLIDLHGNIKQERFKKAEILNKKLYKQYLEQFINKEIEVIFEKYENGIYIGKSSEYAKVLLKSNDKSLLNKFICVKVNKVVNNELICKIV